MTFTRPPVRNADVVLGCMYYGTRIDQQIAFRMLDTFVDAGGHAIDTANNYAFWETGSSGGESEATLGAWLAEAGHRAQVSVATKVGARPTRLGGTLDDAEGLSAPIVRAAVEGSLARLGIDTIDRCYAHIDDRSVPLEETLGAFSDLIAEGKIGDVAGSNLCADRLQEALAISDRANFARYSALQQRHSLLEPISGSDFGVQKATTPELLDIIVAQGIALVAYSPMLEGSALSRNRPLPENYDSPDNHARRAALETYAANLGVSPGQLVIATLLAQGVSPLIGARTPEQLLDSMTGRTIAAPATMIADVSAHRSLTTGQGAGGGLSMR